MIKQQFESIYKPSECKFKNIYVNTLIKLFMAGILLFIGSCTTKHEEYGCVGCPSVALRIQLQDSQDSSMIANAEIIAINTTKRDTVTVDSAYLALWGTTDSAGQYIVYGLPGEYSISISHPLYESFSQNGLNVSQWSEVTCEHANTENLIIAVDKLNLKKRDVNKSSGIISRKTEGHC
jgi:hypothetical protein